MKILIGQTLRGEPLYTNGGPLLALLIFIGFGFLFIPRLKYVLLNKKRWGKI